MSKTDYDKVFRYHAIPERTDKLSLGSATKRWLSATVATITAATSALVDATVTGILTVTGTSAFSGSVAFTGATAGVRGDSEITTAATDTVTAAESGKTFVCTATTGTQVFTLPAAATAGLTYTFVCGHADGEIHLAVATGDRIVGKTHGAENATGLITTVTTGLLKNTAVTNVVGDFVTVTSDGSVSWYMKAVAGVWSAT